jgi:hypothetical protein
MTFSNPDTRRALRSIVEAVTALCLVGLLFWLTSLLEGIPAGLEAIARGSLIILGLNAVFYGAENVSRAISLTGPMGLGAKFGPDAPQAAQTVADSAQQTADVIKDAAP